MLTTELVVRLLPTFTSLFFSEPVAMSFLLRYTGAYEGYPAPRDGYGARRYGIVYFGLPSSSFFLLVNKINKNENNWHFF